VDAHDEATTDAAPPAPARSIVTYHHDVRPLLEQHCLPCHARQGSAALALDDWSSTERVKSALVDAVQSDRMPPSPASRVCRAYAQPELQRDTFTRWRDLGFVEGAADEYQPPTRNALELGPAELSLRPEQAYTPPANTDEYRCFLLGAVGESYVRALAIAPEQPLLVHHAQLHRLSEAQRVRVQQLDLEHAGPGYPCANGPGVDSELLYSYRPGTSAVAFQAGDAAYVAGDSTLLLQVHYNTELAAPRPDQTVVSLWTLAAGQLPERVLVRTGSTASISIPAGAPSHVALADSPMRMIGAFGSFFGFGGVFIPGEVVGIAPHAHRLATRMQATLRRGDDAPTCLVDVPRWDFHLQLDYMFTRGVPYRAEDRLTIRCEYDNSAGNQPVIAGVQAEPREVSWGERSSDEMCLFYLWLRFDRAAFEAARTQLMSE
jgi:Copper type II ascorbate-dependent monooxygenase, C-terminal domain